MTAIPLETEQPIARGVSVRFVDAGHIIGSSSVVLTVEEVGSPGEGLIMHLNGEQARRLRVALRDALREIGESPGD